MNMLTRLLEILPSVHVPTKDMDTPFTLDREGRPVTLRELRALHGAGQSHTVLSVEEVNEGFMVECAVRALRDMPQDHTILSGRQSYTPEELIREIEMGTDMVHAQARAHRNYHRFLEKALHMGKILEVPNPG